MQFGRAALESTDWSRLFHAYGRANDTPAHLLALLEEDAAGRKATVDHLWSAILHQGTAWTATAPVARVLAGLLSDERIDRGAMPVRAHLLAFLAAVAAAPFDVSTPLDELRKMAEFDLGPLIDAGDDEAIYGGEAASNAFYAQSILACVEVRPVIMDAMLRGLLDGDPRVRAHAAAGAAMLVSVPGLREKAGPLEEQIAALARRATNSDERAAMVMALGDMSTAPIAFLTDPSPAVRICAALARAMADHPAATALLVDALANHAGEIDGWFTDRPPQFRTRVRFYVVTAALERVKEFDRLVHAAEAVARVTTHHCVDFEWGNLLAAAFPGGSGTVRTTAQRRFLAALVDNADLWNPRNGNAYKWFKLAGLPFDREECRRISAI